MFELTLLVIYRIVQAEKGWHVSLLVRSCWRCLRLTVLTRLLARWVVWNGRIIEHRQHLLLEAHKHPLHMHFMLLFSLPHLVFLLMLFPSLLFLCIKEHLQSLLFLKIFLQPYCPTFQSSPTAQFGLSPF